MLNNRHTPILLVHRTSVFYFLKKEKKEKRFATCFTGVIYPQSHILQMVDCSGQRETLCKDLPCDIPKHLLLDGVANYHALVIISSTMSK